MLFFFNLKKLRNFQIETWLKNEIIFILIIKIIYLNDICIGDILTGHHTNIILVWQPTKPLNFT